MCVCARTLATQCVVYVPRPSRSLSICVLSLGLHLNGLVVASMWQSLQECRVKGVSSGEEEEEQEEKEQEGGWEERDAARRFAL